MTLHEVAFQSGQIVLSGTLARPSASMSGRAVILAAGSGHHDRDETVCGKRPFKTISNSLVAKDFIVLRFDSRGVGKSEGSVDDTTFQSKVDDLLAAHTFLSSAGLSPERIAFVGHSEGGLTAAVAAARVAAPVAMLAGPAVPIDALLHQQAWRISSEAGATAAQLAHERQMNGTVFAIARATETRSERQRLILAAITDGLRTWPDQVWSSESQIAEAAETMTSIVAAPDYCTLLRQSPAKILSAVQSPILALFGDKDTQVEAEPNFHAFLAATSANPNAEAHVLADHNHLFQEAESGEIEEYERLGEAPSAEALNFLVTWLARVV